MPAHMMALGDQATDSHFFVHCWDPDAATHVWGGPEKGFVPLTEEVRKRLRKAKENYDLTRKEVDLLVRLFREETDQAPEIYSLGPAQGSNADGQC